MKREFQTIDERIQSAGWFPGTEADWQNLPITEREALSFTATGCQVAYPTWSRPVNCLHSECRLRRGEIKPIQITNGTLRYEAESGWLRFCNRKRKAAIFRAVRSAARRTGVYDPWRIPGGWQTLVYGGVSLTS